MAYPTILRQVTTGYASNTFIDAAQPSLTGVTDGCVILIVSTRVTSAHSLLSGSGWFEMGQIARTSGAIGTTSIWGRYTTGSSTIPRIASSQASTWYVTAMVFEQVQTLPIIQEFSLGTASSSAAQTTNAITPPAADTLVIGVFTDARTTTMGGTPTSPAVEYLDSFNATYDQYHWIGYKQVASPASTSITMTPSTTASLRESVFAVQGYATNNAPTFSIQPSFATGRTYAFGPAGAIPDLGQGSSNGGTISFRATDAEETGTNALTYEIRSSATPGAGTLMATGTCTSGVTKTHAITNSTTGFTSNGDKSVYIHVSDGTSTTVSNLLTIRVDESNPSAVTSISTAPSPVNDYERYQVTFTPNDTTSPGTGDLRYEIRTDTNGAGTQLASGSATNAVAVTTVYFNDTALALGSNTRYIRVQDAGGNITQTTFTVTKSNTRAWDQVTTLATGTDDGYWTPTSTTINGTSTIAVVGWAGASIRYNEWHRFQLLAEPTYNIDYAMIRMGLQGVFAGAITIRIRGVLELNPAAPTTVAGANALPLTAAYADWSTASWSVDGMPLESPDLSAIFEEIMAQPGWTSGNYVMLIFDTTTSYVNTTYQARWDSFENSDTTPRMYVDWTAEVIYDEVSTTADVIYTQTTGSVDNRIIDAEGGDHVIMGSVTTGDDGMVWTDLDLIGEIPVRTEGVETGTLTDLGNPQVGYVSTISTVLALQMVEEGQEGVLSAFTGGIDVGTFNEFEGSVEAILEALSTLEDHDMYDLETVEVIAVYLSGFDQVEGELDDSNPVIMYVETMGMDAFELGPQVYDEETIDVTVAIHPQLSGEDVATMHDLLEVDEWHALTDFDVEFFQGRFEEFNDPIAIPSVEVGVDTMVMNASLEEVHEIPVVTTSTVDAQSMFEPTGEIMVGVQATSSVEMYVHGETGGTVLIEAHTAGEELTGYVELTGVVVIGIQTHADEGMVMNETDGATIIGVTSVGYEGNFFEDYGNQVVIHAVTTSTLEEIFIRVPLRYYRSALVVIDPYEASTLQATNPYHRSSLVTLKPMRESVLAAT